MADHNLITEHIESYESKISYFRREHAPNSRYFNNPDGPRFQEKHPNIKMSYYLYRSEVAKLNISFLKFANEECEQYEHFHLHGHTEEDFPDNCKMCKIWISKLKNLMQQGQNIKATQTKDQRMAELYIHLTWKKVIGHATNV